MEVDVNKPNYYVIKVNGNDVECFDVIKALGLNKKYLAATAFKYLFRMGRKTDNEISDCKKAIRCLQEYLKDLEEIENKNSKFKSLYKRVYPLQNLTRESMVALPLECPVTPPLDYTLRDKYY